jgi:endonuclease/exonuclease/phosphatase family metal-dependent hydrolase
LVIIHPPSDHLLRSFNNIEVKEIHLHGRKFTWSSGNQTLTQTKIDHVFATKEWEILHVDCHLPAGGTSMSDHCPMVLTCSPLQARYTGFIFEP